MKIAGSINKKEYDHSEIKSLSQLQGIFDDASPDFMNYNIFEVFYGFLSLLHDRFKKNSFFNQIFGQEVWVMYPHPELEFIISEQPISFHVRILNGDAMYAVMFNRFHTDDDTSKTSVMEDQIKYLKSFQRGELSISKYTLFAVFARNKPNVNYQYGMNYALVKVDGTHWTRFEPDKVGTKVDEHEALNVLVPDMLFYTRVQTVNKESTVCSPNSNCKNV